MLREKNLDLAGLRLHVVTGPENGPPLVMFHGVLRNWLSFLPIVASLSLRHQLFLIDWPGHGQSGRLNRYLVTDYVDVACRYVRESFPAPVRLYGHSLGAMVALAVAAELPDLVAGAILEDPPFDTMGRSIGETVFLSQFQGTLPFAGSPLPVSDIARSLAQIPLHDPATGRTFRLGDVRDAAALRFSAACLKQVDPAVLDPIVAGQWLDGYDLDRVAAKLRPPVLILQADPATGGMLTTGDLAHIQRLAPHIDSITLPGVGHSIHWSRPDQLLSLAHAFLESL